MKKGKLNASGQAERRQQIIEYIRQHGSVSSGQICADLNLSRSSLHDDILAIRASGVELMCPKRGIYVLSKNVEKSNIPPTIDKVTVRRWRILACLSDPGLNREELLSKLKEMDSSCSDSTLESDIKALQNLNLIWKDENYPTNSEDHSIYYHSALYPASTSQIDNYLETRRNAHQTPGLEIENYREIDRIIDHVFQKTEPGNNANDVFMDIGRKNTFSKQQLNSLTALKNKIKNGKNFTTYKLQISFIDKKKQPINFSTGLIVYSVETNRIYLMGCTDQQDAIIPLDTIDISETKLSCEINKIYNSTHFNNIYNDMINISTEEAVDVRIRFENQTFVKEKINRLKTVRNNCKIVPSKDGKEIIYTDTIRGMNDFARYLRRFGSSVIVEKPEILKEKMIESSEKVIKLYQESNQHE